jgi:hypothetical protein
MTPPLLLYIVAEGQSERDFISKVIAPYLRHLYTAAGYAVVISPVVVTTSMNQTTGQQHRGGGDWTKWQKTIEDQLRVAQRQPKAFVSTLFDLFRLPKNLPFSAQLKQISDGNKQADYFEAKLWHMWDRPPRFIPYIQKYEFEAFVFARLPLLLDIVEPSKRPALTALQMQTANLSPEDINGGDDTAPSKRLAQALPGYSKTLHGLLVLEEGDAIERVDALRAVCPRFHRWIEQLESLCPEH